MNARHTIGLSIERLGISGLTQAEGARLEAALSHELERRLMASGVENLGGPVELGDLQLALPRRGEPEAMGTEIGARLAAAIAPPAGSDTRSPAGAGKGPGS